MLLWGLAAVVPIVIHLWSKRRYQEVSWAAMDFLVAALRKNARRIRLEQWVLLALRTLVLLLLAAALAEPAVTLLAGLRGGARRGPTHWVLVLDGSFSMAYRADERSHFDAARELAGQMVSDCRQGDGFTLILMGSPPRAVIAAPAFDGDDVIGELDELTPDDSGASLLATLQLVGEVIDRAAKQYPRLTTTKVCFLTDLDQAAWRDVTSDACREVIGALADRGTLLLADLGQAGRRNVAVTDLRLGDDLLSLDREIQFQATVQRFGPAGATTKRVEILVDGRRLDEQVIDLTGDSASVTFSHRFETPGEHVVQVAVPGDGLEIDNERWLSVPLRESIKVLCVRGKQDAARYVAYALEPRESTRPAVRWEIVPESALLERELAEYDCLFLCNVGRFGREETAALTRYRALGRGLVFFLGDQVQADNYNELLGGEFSGKPVIPVRLGAAVGDGNTLFGLDPLGYRHELLEVFRDAPNTGLLTTPVWRYLRLEPIEATGAQVVLAFDNGDPALVEAALGGGRSLVFATAASPASLDRSGPQPRPWTDIASWPSFPPLVQEMLSFVVRCSVTHRQLEVGQPMMGSLPNSSGTPDLQVTDPTGSRERVTAISQGGEAGWVYENTRRRGIYRAQGGSPEAAEQLYAVNVGTAESSLERFDVDALPSQFQRGLTPGDPSDATASIGGRRPLFRLLLAGVLALLLAESFCAWRFGNAAA